MASTAKPNPPAVIPPLSRFLLWQIVGLVGFLHILYYAPAGDPTPLVFLCNAVVFLAVYPLLYFYYRLSVPAFFKVILSPLQAVLQVLLLITAYIWTTFAPYYPVLFLLFVVDYIFFFQHLFGVSGHDHSFWSSAGILSDAVSGVVLGYGLGRALDTKGGPFFWGDPVRVMFWMMFILVGVAAVVWFNAKTRKG